MAEENDKEQLQQSGNNHTAHALYASGSIYAATKVGVAAKIQILVRPKPDQPDRLLRPMCEWRLHDCRYVSGGYMTVHV